MRAVLILGLAVIAALIPFGGAAAVGGIPIGCEPNATTSCAAIVATACGGPWVVAANSLHMVDWAILDPHGWHNSTGTSSIVVSADGPTIPGDAVNIWVYADGYLVAEEHVLGCH